MTVMRIQGSSDKVARHLLSATLLQGESWDCGSENIGYRNQER
jgi:hypothetical protein